MSPQAFLKILALETACATARVLRRTADRLEGIQTVAVSLNGKAPRVLR